MPSWLKNWRRLLLARPKPNDRASSGTPLPVLEGSERGWLRVLTAQELLSRLKAHDALEAMWRQSRLAAVTWQRDLLPAIHRLAEFVQLMPASESHHHAHVGGLLTHTLEMALAAMTWRNGHFLPAGAPIEQIDAERDEWTYVVFFAALLHDIAKPMTDLRVQWRAARMPEPLRWTPVAGSLVQLAEGRQEAEYLVEFTPKSAREYGAHSRLALTILHQIAPATALAFLARKPHALDTLTQYLAGQDQGSIVARIVMRADQASTAKALLHGSRARFETASSMPLIELLMNAVKSMLKSSTALPLNRSGAAGWIHDGSVWFVAKRLADAVRAWVKEHAPDESIPGDSKNDRLFDTWQEYGCILVNPHTGQAIWYVTVQGDVEQESGAGQGNGSIYSHSLSMLRFPLEKLYDDASQYPPPMSGRIEIRDKRPAKGDALEDAPEPIEPKASQTQTSPDLLQVKKQKSESESAIPAQTNAAEASASTSKANKPAAPGLRAPSFNKPRPATNKENTPKPAAKESKREKPVTSQVEAAATKSTPPIKTDDVIAIGGGIDGFDAEDEWLDEEDDVHILTSDAPELPLHRTGKQRDLNQTAEKVPKPIPAEPAAQRRPSLARPVPTVARSTPTVHAKSAPATATNIGQSKPVVRPLFRPPESAASAPASSPTRSASPDPVVLTPALPELPQETARRKVEPSDTAVAFMQWVQQGLAGQSLKYNESGAPVHFTAEGMALVSPLIFKLYARETGPESEADAMGLQVQREVIKAGWHRMGPGQGRSKVNILRYEVQGRGGTSVGKLSAVVLSDPDRWVLPVPPSNPVLKLV